MGASGVAVAGVSVFVVLIGLVGLVGLVLAARFGSAADAANGDSAAGDAAKGGPARVLLLSGLAAAGVLVGLIGTMIQGYTVRIGGSAPGLKDAADPASGTTGGSAGFAFPLGAVIGLALLTALLLVAGTVLRQPLAVGVAAGGWLAVVATLMFGMGSAGDVILANTSSAQVFVYGGLVIAFGFGVLVYQWQLTDRLARAAANRAR